VKDEVPEPAGAEGSGTDHARAPRSAGPVPRPA